MGTVLNIKDMGNLREAATQYAVDNVQGSFSGNEEELRMYAREDFLAGALWGTANSKVDEMLEMLDRAKSMLGNFGEFEIAKEIEQLIKEATEL